MTFFFQNVEVKKSNEGNYRIIYVYEWIIYGQGILFGLMRCVEYSKTNLLYLLKKTYDPYFRKK